MRIPQFASPRIHTRLLTTLGAILLAANLASADNWTINTAGGQPIRTTTTTTKVGIGLTGSTAPRGLLDVEGSTVVGTNYSGNSSVTPPSNGLLVEGNVGIGTSTITSGVKLEVNGTIKANKIQIKTWTMEVPDYVFHKDYALPPLSETEKFIRKNKHLPEVPSAKTMKKDGMNLAELNLILLKKVEELTLHAIEQEKQIKSLAAKMGK